MWFIKHGGSVLATTINKYCYITCRHLPPFFEHRIRVVYSKIESCKSYEEVNHPAVREIMRFLNFERGVEIHHDGDLPARSGMGSSSAFTVGLLNALYALKGVMPSKKQLATESIHIEQNMIQETVGSQDQVLAAYGGFSQLQFFPNGEFTVRPVIIPSERLHELNSCLMLFYTGIKRTASEVAESFVKNIDKKKRQLRIMKDLVDESMTILNSGQNIDRFGDLLHEAWLAKRSLSSKVSNNEVDALYDQAMTAGAVGGKLTGAGGGGFLLLFVPPERQSNVREKLRKLIYVPFKFEYSGSQIIFFDPEEDFTDLDEERKRSRISEFRELNELEDSS
jgi:D-glycero-alpha-D-manno-heptose-7-phosphate kinase